MPAMKFKSESPGLCCAGGKIKLPVLTHPPEPLYSFLYGNTTESKYFFANIQKYNGCFQMTSLEAEVVDLTGYNPSLKVMASHYYKLAILIFFSNYLQTFKIQVQIHHRVGSLLPPPNEDHKYLQLYFVGDSATELEKRCAIFNATNREIIAQLQNQLHEHNELV